MPRLRRPGYRPRGWQGRSSEVAWLAAGPARTADLGEALQGGLPLDAERVTDLGPRVVPWRVAQLGDRVNQVAVQLVAQAGEVGERGQVTITDTARVGAQDPPHELLELWVLL